MRIVIDLDGVVCEIREDGQVYSELLPVPGAIEKLSQFKKSGHYIILYTARNMATCDSNLGKVIKNIGQITLEWLANHNVVYDEIYFGKPNGELYIDDRGFRFKDWSDIDEPLLTSLVRLK